MTSIFFSLTSSIHVSGMNTTEGSFTRIKSPSSFSVTRFPNLRQFYTKRLMTPSGAARQAPPLTQMSIEYPLPVLRVVSQKPPTKNILQLAHGLYLILLQNKRVETNYPLKKGQNFYSLGEVGDPTFLVTERLVHMKVDILI